MNEQNPQEPPHHPEENNPQEPLPSDHTISLHIEEKFLFSNWYQDIVNFLIHFKCPSSFSKSQCIALKLKAVKYCIINSNLYHKVPLNILLLYLTESETEGIIDQFHTGFCGGHYAWREKIYKILRAIFYWPTLFLQVGAKVRSCVPCQRFASKQKLAALPLIPAIVSTPFLQ